MSIKKGGGGVTVLDPFKKLPNLLLPYEIFKELLGPILWLFQYRFCLQTNYLGKLLIDIYRLTPIVWVSFQR